MRIRQTLIVAATVGLAVVAVPLSGAGAAEETSRVVVQAEVETADAANPLDRLGDFVAVYRYQSVRPDAVISGVALDEERSGYFAVKRIGANAMISLSTKSPRAIDRDGVPRLTWVRNSDAWFLEHGVFLHELSGDDLIEVPAPAAFHEELPPFTTDLGYSWTGGRLEATAACVQRAVAAGGASVDAGPSSEGKVHEVFAPVVRTIGAVSMRRVTRWVSDPETGKPTSELLVERYSFPDATSIDVVAREREVFRRMDELASGIRVRIYDVEGLLENQQPETPAEFAALLGEDGRPPLAFESTFELVEFRSPRAGESANVHAVEEKVAWAREKFDSEPRRVKSAATDTDAGGAPLLRYDAASARFIPVPAQP